MRLTLEERNHLILTHIDLADKIARKRKKAVARRVQLDELKSAAYLGLVDAAERFDAGKGNFRSYAAYRIVGEINEHLRRELFWGPTKPPSPPASLDEHEEKFEALLITQDDDGASFPEFLERLIKCLPQQGKDLFRWYYRDHLTLREIAGRLGISESYVSVIMSRHKKTIQAHWLPQRHALGAEAETRRIPS